MAYPIAAGRAANDDPGENLSHLTPIHRRHGWAFSLGLPVPAMTVRAISGRQIRLLPSFILTPMGPALTVSGRVQSAKTSFLS